MNATETAAELNAAADAAADLQRRTVAGNLIMAINAYGDLVKGFNKHMAWQLACQRYAAGQLLGPTFYNPEPKGTPSKAAKHRMYGDAGRLISILALDVARPTTLPMIADVIAAAAAKLMAR
jgi:hypothetical protein